MSEMDRLNTFAAQADEMREGGAEGLAALFGVGKRIPYMGWFWREVDWETFALSAGHEFIGFDEAGKWDYPHYKPTPQQRAGIVERMTAAADHFASDPEDEDGLYAALRELWDFMQTCTDSGLCWECWGQPRKRGRTMCADCLAVKVGVNA